MAKNNENPGDGADKKDQVQQPNAAARVDMVAKHLPPNPQSKSAQKSRRKRSELPRDYSDITNQLNQLRDIAGTPNQNSRGYARQMQAGKLWVRDRIEKLVDKDSFNEVGSVSGTVKWKNASPTSDTITDFIPSNNIQGFARIGGRRVVFTADDFTIRAGHADGASMSKTVYMEQMSVAMRLPMIKLNDGSSGGGSVTTIAKDDASYVPQMNFFGPVVQQLNLGIPNLGACLGPAIGLGAARVAACHFSVMAADVGSLFAAGPQVVENSTFEKGLTPKTLGGPEVHCANGTIDNMAKSEADCFDQIRTVLSYLPNSGLDLPPVLPCTDPTDRTSPELRTIIPRRQARAYNPRKIIKLVVDEGSWFEIGSLWGITSIVGLARLGGRPVGVVASNCEVKAGALDALGSQKIRRHLKFCDVFNIPIIQFVDVPGYAIGTEAERSAVLRHGVDLGVAYFATTTPIFSVLVRKVYGVAGGLMVDSREPRMRVAWPSGEWGSLPLEGGVEVGHRHELREVEAQKGPEARHARYQELYQNYRRLMNPVRTANSFGIEEIIDPAGTRSLLCEWTAQVYESMLPVRIAERASGKLVPTWT